jgi:hypothetical protein
MRREPALEAGKTWRLPHDFEMRGGMQFMDQRSVGEELLGSFTTQHSAGCWSSAISFKSDRRKSALPLALGCRPKVQYPRSLPTATLAADNLRPRNDGETKLEKL